MNASSVILTLPPDLYDRVQRIAEAAEQSVEVMLLQQIEHALNDPLTKLPLDEQAELHALKFLSDEAFWTIAREKMPISQ